MFLNLSNKQVETFASTKSSFCHETPILLYNVDSWCIISIPGAFFFYPFSVMQFVVIFCPVMLSVEYCIMGTDYSALLVKTNGYDTDIMLISDIKLWSKDHSPRSENPVLYLTPYWRTFFAQNLHAAVGPFSTASGPFPTPNDLKFTACYLILSNKSFDQSVFVRRGHRRKFGVVHILKIVHLFNFNHLRAWSGLTYWQLITSQRK